MGRSREIFRFGPFVLDDAERTLARAGAPVALTPKLFDLLRILVTSEGRPLEKGELMQAAWPDSVVVEGNLAKEVFRLRQALGDTGEDRTFIETAPRVGYRFVAPVTRVGAPVSAPAPADHAGPGETRYAKSGDVHIAYQVVGEGGPDLVFVPGWVSHVEHAWEDPLYSRFLRRLASFSRLILLDRRGTGLSDRVADMPSLEQRMDDVRAVMDAAGSEEAALFGISEGGPMCLLFAAAHPERTRALVLYGTIARFLRTEDYPLGIPPEDFEAFVERVVAEWGTGVSADYFAPSVAQNEAFRRSWGRFERFSVSPAGAQALLRMIGETDVRHVLPAVRVPTLVLGRQGDLCTRVDGVRYVADGIAGARWVELPGSDHVPWVGDAGALLDEVEEFLTGARSVQETDRVLATILFTDIVGSTSRAAGMGDARWRDVLANHDALARREIARFGGREVKTVGDGFLAIFDGPARAIRCACAIRDGVRRLGMEIRAGLHCGECELTPTDVGGIAVHIGARVVARAAPGEVLVSRTVKDLVAGSRLRFADRGTHDLAGVPGDWNLFAAEG
jgi:class 3 adenylate cyclase/DNA-binding winged helix-turn-helix (wHTH) protein